MWWCRLSRARQQRGTLAHEVSELEAQTALQRQAEFVWLQVQHALYKQEGALREEYDQMVEHAKVGRGERLRLGTAAAAAAAVTALLYNCCWQLISG